MTKARQGPVRSDDQVRGANMGRSRDRKQAIYYRKLQKNRKEINAQKRSELQEKANEEIQTFLDRNASSRHPIVCEVFQLHAAAVSDHDVVLDPTVHNVLAKFFFL